MAIGDLFRGSSTHQTARSKAASIAVRTCLRPVALVDLMLLAERAIRFVSAAELHGAVCGLAAGQARGHRSEIDAEVLVEALSALLGSDALQDEESLEAFLQASLAALFAEDLSFQPLLPTDDAPLAVRVEAVAEWCGAFAAGYGACQTAAGDLMEDGQSDELLADFVAISGAQAEEQDDEEAEAALVELTEYVKVGALLLVSGAGDHGGD